jgi:hypothetical protein
MTFHQVISIHGAPRSGTTWLGQIFNKHSDVVYKFQPLFAYRFKDRLSLDSPPEDIQTFFEELYQVNDDDFISGKWPKSNDDQTFLKMTFDKKKQPGFMVMKEVRYHHLIERLINAVPNIKIIGIVRNPCAVMNSWLNAPKEFEKGWDVMAEWRRAPSKNQGRIEEYYGYEKWKELALTFLDYERKYPRNFFLIQYERLVSSPIEIVRKAFSFSGLSMEKQVIDFVKVSQSYHVEDTYAVYKFPSVKDRWRTELDDRISKEIIEDVTGTELEKFLE